MFVPDPHAVAREMDRLTASLALKGSKRSQEFLRHVVDAALRGEGGTLKERTIGVALFRRATDYDTSDDAIVRVKANEVRRRLAQAYQELGPAPEVEIALPPGSYVPEFRPVVAAVAAALPEARPGMGRRGKALWAAAALVAVAGLAATAVWLRGNDLARQLWQPLLAAEGPVLICLARTASGGQQVEDHVAAADMLAAVRLAAHLAQAGKPYRIVSGSDTSFLGDRRSPEVLLGSLARQPALQDNDPLRFVFDGDEGAPSIEDTAGEGRRWALPAASPSADYVVVTRLLEASTGRPVILAAGLSDAGTQAAGEFLANAAAVDALLAELETGWQRKNLQLVLRVQVRGASVTLPELVAAHVW